MDYDRSLVGVSACSVVHSRGQGLRDDKSAVDDRRHFYGRP